MNKDNLHTSIVAGVSATAGALIASLVAGFFTLEAARVSSKATVAASAANSNAQNAMRIAEMNREKAVPFYLALSAFSRASVVGQKNSQDLQLAWAELDRSAAALDPYVDYVQSSRLAQVVIGYRLLSFEPENFTAAEKEKLLKARKDFDLEFHAINERLEFTAQSSPEDQKELYQLKQKVWEESLYPLRQLDGKMTP